MEHLTNIAAEATYRYFDSLAKFGYKNYKDVERLLVLNYIESLLSKDYFEHITEEDYRIISNALNCLFGSNCMIDMPSYFTDDSLIHEINKDLLYRVSNNNALRICEGYTIRAKI